MVYEYVNEAGKIIEKNFSMSGDIPREVKENGVLYKRRYTMGHGGIRIPDGWGENKISFNKSPSRRKHYY